jgi:hypothetical protein
MILERLKLQNKILFDEVDLDAISNGILTDSNYWHKQIFSDKNYIFKGFTLSASSAQLSVELAGSVLLLSESDSDFSYNIISSDSLPFQTTDLVPSARNFIELQLINTDSDLANRKFLDKTINILGSETQRLTTTAITTEVNITSNIVKFTKSGNYIPIGFVDTDVDGNIVNIQDKRNLFHRLDNPKNLAFNPSVSKPLWQVTLSGIGVYLADEVVTFSVTGSATAKVVTGGDTLITITDLSDDDFFVGDTLTGTDSGATNTVVSVKSLYLMGDSGITNFKQWQDSVMQNLKIVKGTDYWYSPACAYPIAGTAGYLVIYSEKGVTPQDNYEQNGNPIQIPIEAHAGLAATRTYTIKNVGADADFIMTEGDQTLLEAIIFEKNSVFTAREIVALDIDWGASKLFYKSLGANTVLTFSNISSQTIRVAIVGNNFTLAFPALAWENDTEPAFSAVTDSTALYEFSFNNGIVYGRQIVYKTV